MGTRQLHHAATSKSKWNVQLEHRTSKLSSLAAAITSAVMQDPFSSLGCPLRGTPEPDARRQFRKPDPSEETSIDEEDRKDLPVTAGEVGVLIDVDDLPFARLVAQELVDLLPHPVAEMTAEAAVEPQVDRTRAYPFQGSSGSALFATR